MITTLSISLCYQIYILYILSPKPLLIKYLIRVSILFRLIKCNVLDRLLHKVITLSGFHFINSCLANQVRALNSKRKLLKKLWVLLLRVKPRRRTYVTTYFCFCDHAINSDSMLYLSIFNEQICHLQAFNEIHFYLNETVFFNEQLGQLYVLG